MTRIVCGTLWSVLFAVAGLTLGVVLDHRLHATGAHPGGRAALVFGGLLLGLAAYAALREAGALPGLPNHILPAAPPTARQGSRLGAILAGIGWGIGFGLVGATIGFELEKHGFPAPRRGEFAFGGMVVGLLLIIPLYRAGLLAGLGRARGGWGIAQAIFLAVGFVVTQGLGQGLLFVIVVIAKLTARAGGHALNVNIANLTITAVAAGYLTAAWWSVWYIKKLGPQRLADGSAAGIGWRPAPGQAYFAAIIGLVVVMIVGALIQHFWPPGAAEVKNNPYLHIFGQSRLGLAMLFLLAAILAPPIEELVFRGGILSALAPKCGALLAALITTILFTAAHVLEFIYYWPGMGVIFAVAVILAWLRLTYHSIRPGILLHILFNTAGVVVMAFR
jgi:membrane protease YdiL (CAAX protease family)